jgi:outer membrane lipoprotein carrier protein LolA
MGRMIVAAALLALGSCAAAADEALVRIRALLDAQPRLRAEFDQTKRSAELERPVLAHGRMLVWREAGVLWQMEQPVKMLVVLREDVTIQIDASGRRRIQSADHDAAAARTGRILGALLNGDTATLEQWFDIAARIDAQQWSIALTPRRGAMAAFLTSMQVSGDKYVRSVAIDEANGDSTHISFRNHRDAAPLTSEEASLLGVP